MSKGTFPFESKCTHKSADSVRCYGKFFEYTFTSPPCLSHQLLQPLQQRFSSLVQNPDFGTTCHDTPSVQELLSLLEALCGLAHNARPALIQVYRKLPSIYMAHMFNVYVYLCMYCMCKTTDTVQASMELGPEDVSLLERCPHFSGCYVQALIKYYVHECMHIFLISGVLRVPSTPLTSLSATVRGVQ